MGRRRSGLWGYWGGSKEYRRHMRFIIAAGFVLVGTFSFQGERATATKVREIPDIAIVQQGKALARVVLPVDAPKSTQDAADLLVDYIKRSTTAHLDVVKEPKTGGANIAIHFGATRYVKGLSLGVEKMDPDGFVIAFPAAKHIVLLGAGDVGQINAAYEFLERYVGVRWLFPGAIGEHVPVRSSLIIPATEVREQPVFRHRSLSGLGLNELPENKGDQVLWGRRNRMRRRVESQHNLWRLFPPERFGKTHPEFFPILNGRRYVPQPAPSKSMEQDVRAQVGWQPCFTAAGLVDEAVKNISDYFDMNPQATSYSLGINDNWGHCECAACIEKDGGGTNVLGTRDASKSYYAWCNAVARGVNQNYPDKHFGLLAYCGVYSPSPGLRLDEHIIPFATYDRMKWVDPDIERRGHALTESWEKTAAVLGWYDYIYGGQFYTAPRVYFHKMAAYLRYGRGHHVRHYDAEAFPSADWHEGPKLYLLLKLLWDPDQDEDTLLKDWYDAAVGTEAAPYLAQYFSLWEIFWTKRVPETGWFRNNGDQQYLPFYKSSYLEALQLADVVESEALLRKAVKSAHGEPQQARAKFFLDGFLARKGEYLKDLPFQLFKDSSSR